MANSSFSSSSSSDAATQSAATLSPPPSFLDGWKERIFYPTVLGGIIGGALGTVSKHRKLHGVANMSATYATNFAIVSGIYCGLNRANFKDVLVKSHMEFDEIVGSLGWDDCRVVADAIILRRGCMGRVIKGDKKYFVDL